VRRKKILEFSILNLLDIRVSKKRVSNVKLIIILGLKVRCSVFQCEL